jgi:hypothetical protein
MDKEVKNLVRNIIDDTNGPTMTYQLLCIIDLYRNYGERILSKDDFPKEAVELMEAAKIALAYLDTKYDLESEDGE